MSRRACARALGMVMLMSLAVLAHAADEPRGMLWAVKGARSTVYLLGSIHMLRQSDRGFPRQVLEAYQRARTIVMEVDLEKALGDGMLGTMIGAGTLPAGQSLEGALGPIAYAKFRTFAQARNFEPAMMSRFQPWLAAMMVTQLQLQSLGFAPDAGIDVQVAKSAAVDGKRVIGLETIEQQLSFFSGMTLIQQRDFLLYTMAESDRAPAQLDQMVSAWQRGDVASLERVTAKSLHEFPDIGRRLVADRNRAWMPAIERVIAGGDDALVVVGALHLVGPDGIVELLRRKGYDVQQR
jgi:uncharacterized protein YbaP (TraB family)